MKGAFSSGIVPGFTAAFCLALTSASTIWSAQPLYGPLDAEFHWPAAAMAAAGFASLGITAASVWPLYGYVRLAGERRIAVAGCLLSGLLLLLTLPNLTHLWQAVLLMLALGLARAGVLAAAWHECRRGLPHGFTLVAIVVAALAGLLIVAPWIGQVVYRNSWREGAAVSGGLLLVLATPLAYILLPGAEPARPARETVPEPVPDQGDPRPDRV